MITLALAGVLKTSGGAIYFSPKITISITSSCDDTSHYRAVPFRQINMERNNERLRMSDKPINNEKHNQPQHYEIRLKGHLDSQWTEWFGGLTITLEEDGTTLLSGPVADQAALHGLLKKVRDLGLPLISVCPCQSTDFSST
jgi:hypothetical protein